MTVFSAIIFVYITVLVLVDLLLFYIMRACLFNLFLSTKKGMKQQQQLLLCEILLHTSCKLLHVKVIHSSVLLVYPLLSYIHHVVCLF